MLFFLIPFMLTNGHLINVKCEICHEKTPNNKCATCTFVICSNCNQGLLKYNLSKSCPGCRRPEPWITNIDPIQNRIVFSQKQNVNIQTPNEYHNSYECHNCNAINQNFKNIKFAFFRLIYFLTFVMFLISIGVISSLITENFDKIQKLPLFMRLCYFLLTGFVTTGICFVVLLLMTLFYVACLKCEDNVLVRNRINVV